MKIVRTSFILEESTNYEDRERQLNAGYWVFQLDIQKEEGLEISLAGLKKHWGKTIIPSRLVDAYFNH